jgi:hypothetical protein
MRRYHRNCNYLTKNCPYSFFFYSFFSVLFTFQSYFHLIYYSEYFLYVSYYFDLKFCSSENLKGKPFCFFLTLIFFLKVLILFSKRSYLNLTMLLKNHKHHILTASSTLHYVFNSHIPFFLSLRLFFISIFPNISVFLKNETDKSH